MLTVQPTMCRRDGKRVLRVGTTRSNSMAYDEEQNNMAKVGSGPAGRKVANSSFAKLLVAKTHRLVSQALSRSASQLTVLYRARRSASHAPALQTC